MYDSEKTRGKDETQYKRLNSLPQQPFPKHLCIPNTFWTVNIFLLVVSGLIALPDSSLRPCYEPDKNHLDDLDD